METFSDKKKISIAHFPEKKTIKNEKLCLLRETYFISENMSFYLVIVKMSSCATKKWNMPLLCNILLSNASI